jgi:AcrR family transcriptional regulator
MSPTLSTKERILASAMHLLDTGGPAAVTLRAVGDATGVSAAAPYRHYEDKRALLEAMVRANLEYFKAAREKARRDANSSFQALDRLVRAYFDFARRFPVRYRFLLEISHEDSQIGAEAREAFGAVASLVREAQERGEIKTGAPEQISALIFGAAYGTADLAQHGEPTAAARDSAVSTAPDLAPLLLDLLARPTTSRQ